MSSVPSVAQGMMPNFLILYMQLAIEDNSFSESIPLPEVTMQNRLTPLSDAVFAAAMISFSGRRGYVLTPVGWWTDWAQNAQSSEQLPDLAFIMEQASTRSSKYFSLSLPARRNISKGYRSRP